MSTVTKFCLVLVACALVALAPPLWNASEPGTVNLIVSVHDEVNEQPFESKAQGSFPRGTNAFDAMLELVEVDYDRAFGAGAFVKGICGIPAPRDMYWALHIDGEYQDEGISSIELDRDMTIAWKLVDMSTLERPTRD